MKQLKTQLWVDSHTVENINLEHLLPSNVPD